METTCLAWPRLYCTNTHTTLVIRFSLPGSFLWSFTLIWINVLLTDNNEDHAKELDPRAQQRTKNHGILWWPENISVNVLPARFFHGVLLRKKGIIHHKKMQTEKTLRQAQRQTWISYNVILSVVVRYVFPQGPDDYHAQDACKHIHWWTHELL